MRKMVYIKRHADSAGTSAGDLRLISEKNEKKFQMAFDKLKKCAILNFCRAFSDESLLRCEKKLF